MPRLEHRRREAARLGFATAVVPPMRKRVTIEGLRIVEVTHLRDALESLGVV